jgi:hypothetical protein
MNLKSSQYFVFVVSCLFISLLWASLSHITVVGQIGDIALLKDQRTKEIKAHRVGSKIFETSFQLKSILGDRIVVLDAQKNKHHVATKLRLNSKVTGGHRTDLSATGSTYREEGLERISTADSISIKVDGNFKRDIVKNLPNIVMEASSDVVTLPDGGVGVKIFNFSDNSLFAKLGLQHSDSPEGASMITSINGQKIQNAVQAVTALREAEKNGADSLSFEIIENGQTKTATINVS